MINNTPPSSPVEFPPPPAGPAAPDDQVRWGRLLLRLFVVVPPAQVIGIVAGGQLLAGTGLLQKAYWLSAAISLLSGVLSGLALGFFLTPTGSQRGTFAIVAAGFALVTTVVLAVLAEVRLAGWGVEPYWYRYLLGAAIVVAAQTPIAWALWRKRATSVG